jgi:hypothetical protein
MGDTDDVALFESKVQKMPGGNDAGIVGPGE